MDGAVELPSGKTAADENFPVGSWLLPAAKRPHVAAYYAFARAADDIADDPALAPDDKVARLTAFGDALESGDGDPVLFAKAHRLRASLDATGVPRRHALDLLSAFKQDAVKRRYADWAELIDYCDRSAAPVGRFLLDLHGEDRALWPATDALCNALQVLNHLQDCGDDRRDLDRVYIPLGWLAERGGDVADLDRPASTPALRHAIDRCLDGVDALLDLARPFPDALRNRRLAAESAVIVGLAERLAVLLRRGDPLAERVALGKGDFALCGVKGLFRGLFAPRRAMPVGAASAPAAARVPR